MRVYSIVGVPPEIQAYAMAKYSRSAQSMGESIGELSEQRAEQFLDTFYFQYGHRSIADLAHLSFGVEGISILAAIALVDEPLWDGQERSTRYQDFRKSGYFTPDGLSTEQREHYERAVESMFAAYRQISKELTALLVAQHPRPESIDPAQFERTLRARAFDVARYCLPLATRTSVGQIVSARSLEQQISRLLSDEFQEVRQLGRALKEASVAPAFSPTWEKIRDLLRSQPESGADVSTAPAVVAAMEALAPRPAAPTLVKYAQPNEYWRDVKSRFQSILERYYDQLPAPEIGAAVTMVQPDSLDEEIVASGLYTVAEGQSYLQVQALARKLSSSERSELLAATFELRGRHDDLLRLHRAGYAVNLDILMDLGSFRDLHRHRRCVQLAQPLKGAVSADAGSKILKLALGEPYAELAEDHGMAEMLDRAMAEAGAAARELEDANPNAGAYLFPLGFRTRCLFKMDFAEAAYIAQLRSAEGGHFSYRAVAFEIHQALCLKWPELASHVPVTNPSERFDLLNR